jgi:hypothetical protein
LSSTKDTDDASVLLVTGGDVGAPITVGPDDGDDGPGLDGAAGLPSGAPSTDGTSSLGITTARCWDPTPQPATATAAAAATIVLHRRLTRPPPAAR